MIIYVINIYVIINVCFTVLGGIINIHVEFLQDVLHVLIEFSYTFMSLHGTHFGYAYGSMSQ